MEKVRAACLPRGEVRGLLLGLLILQLTLLSCLDQKGLSLMINLSRLSII